MPALEQVLKQKAAEISGNPTKMAKVRDWIDGYRGKILNFKTKGTAYHLVFTKEGVACRAGEYPSVELTYIGEEDALSSLVRGETTTRDAAKAGKLKTWHNLHEAVRFEEVLKT